MRMKKKISILLLVSAGISILFGGCGSSNSNKATETTGIGTTAQKETQRETQTTLSEEDKFKNNLKWIIEPQYDYTDVEPLVDVLPFFFTAAIPLFII